MQSCEAGLVPVLSALLTPTIAALALLIAYLQWRTNDNKLKHDRFDRRWSYFDATRKFIQSIIVSGHVEESECIKFASFTVGAGFVFDKKIADYMNEVYDKAIDLDQLIQEKDEKKVNAAKKWFRHTLSKMDDQFVSYF